jgi:hypothetical protein
MQALDALESSRIFVITREKTKHPEGTEWYDSAITALKAALEQPEQGPVAIPDCGEAGHADGACGTSECLPSFRRKTTPPAAQQRKPLTDDQIDEIAVIARRGNLHDLRIAIEAKLKERNT